MTEPGAPEPPPFWLPLLLILIAAAILGFWAWLPWIAEAL